MSGWNSDPVETPEDLMALNFESKEVDQVLNFLGNQFRDAEARGKVIVRPGPRELQLDIDTKEDLKHCGKVVHLLARHGYPLAVKRCTPSPSGRDGRYHVMLEVSTELTDERRILLQAVLGSDRTREALGFLRTMWQIPDPSVLYENANALPMTPYGRVGPVGVDDVPDYGEPVT